MYLSLASICLFTKPCAHLRMVNFHITLQESQLVFGLHLRRHSYGLTTTDPLFVLHTNYQLASAKKKKPSLFNVKMS